MNKIKWELFVILSLALFWLFPIVTIFTYNYIWYALSLAYSSFFSFLFFLILFFKNSDYKYFFIKEGWFYLLATSFINGVLFYLLIFYGLQFTTANNSSILWLTEVFFSFLLFWLIFWSDKAKIMEIIGTLFILIWVFVVIFPWTLSLKIWDLFIILSTFFAPIWNYFSKKSIQIFSSRFLMLFRSFVATVFLFFYVYVNGEIYTDKSSIFYALPYLLFNWIVLFWISKILWLEWLKILSVHRATIFVGLLPIFTIIYNIILFQLFPNIYQIFWLIPIILWIYFIFRDKLKD